MTTERYIRPWFRSDFIYYLTKQGKEYKNALTIMHNFTLKVILRKQAERSLKLENAKAIKDDTNEVGENIFRYNRLCTMYIK